MTQQHDASTSNAGQGEQPPLLLPCDAPQSSRTYRNAAYISPLDAEIAERLQQTACSEPNRYTALLIAVFAAWLHRITGEEAVGFTAVAAGGQAVPLAVSFEEKPVFEQLIRAVAGQFEERANEPLDAAIADVLFNGAPAMLQPGRQLLLWQLDLAAAPAGLHIHYDASVFHEATVRRFAGAYIQLLQAALAGAPGSIGSFSIMTAADLQLYEQLNDTAAEYPRDATFHGSFEAAAALFGSRTAVSSPQAMYTYAELNERANRLAHKLLQLGLGKGQFVALFMQRSVDTVVSLLAVMKAGGVYVPMDPEHPEDRIRYIIEDTLAPIVLSHAACFDQALALAGTVASVREVVAVDGDLTAYPSENPAVGVTPDDLAYVIYTSGSTGMPKGTLIAHEGVVNMGRVLQTEFEMNEYDVLPQFATYSFDASVWDTVAALFHGAHLYLLSAEERVSVEAFASAVERTGTTKITVLPTVFFNQILAYLSDDGYRKLEKVKLVMVGGEALNGEHVRAFQRRFGSRIAIYNLYGPTECTVVATMHKVEGSVPEHVAQIPIGRPLPNYRVYVVSAEGQLCPVNVPGELYISTVGIARGYLNQPEKTAAAFIDSPFAPGCKAYRSGDIVKLLGDGTIEYVGRRDNQVKIRGHRIEIGAIEDTFTQYPNIRDAVVVPVKDEDGHTMLSGFYTARDGALLDAAAIKDYLAGKLPGYYVPKSLKQLDAMPVSPTGKIDRKQLAAYPLAAEQPEQDGAAEPLSAAEQRIAELWQKLLKLGRVRACDDFFELGGDSLNVIQLLVQLKPAYPQLTLDALFEYRTLARLAQHLQVLENAAAAAAAGDAPPSTPAWDGRTFRRLIEHPLRFGQTSGGKRKYADPRHVLLTGGTGFLGSRILYDLLRMSTATIYALVRGPQPGIGEQRLLDIMQHYFGREVLQLMKDRVVMIEGNLDREELCEHPHDYQMLKATIDTIVHAAADVRHFGDRRKFERTNIAGTVSLIKLAAAKPGVRFHYISTIGIPEELAELGLWEEALQHERIPADIHVKGVYTESKLAAEKIVLAAAKGLAVTVYRPGNLTCDSQTGVFQRNIDGNAFYRMLKAMLLLERSPRARWLLDLTPIDYAGQAIAALMLRPDTVGRMFHICNPNPLLFDDLLAMINQLGYRVDLMEPSAYAAWLLDSDVPKSETGVELAMAYLEGDGVKDSPFTFSCGQTMAYLTGTGVKCPAVDIAFIDRMFSKAASLGYFPAVKLKMDV